MQGGEHEEGVVQGGEHEGGVVQGGEHEEGVVQGGIGQAHVHKISYSKVGLANNSVIEQQKVEEDKYY